MQTSLQRSLLKFWLALLCVCASWVALPAHASAKDYVSASAYWEDRSGQATFEQAQQHTFTPYQGILNRGYTSSAHWVRLHIDGADTPVAGDKLVLRIRPVFLDSITLFDPADPNPKRPRVAGDLTPWSEAEWQSSDFGFVIPAQAQPRDIWIRLQSTSTHFMVIDALSLAEAKRLDHIQELVYTSSIGVLFFFWAWMLIAWLNDRDKLNGVFVVKQSMMIVYTLAYFGYHRIVLSEWLTPETLDRFFNYANIAAAGTAIWFERYLICEYTLPMWVRHSIRSVVWLIVIPLVLMMAGQTQLAMQINLILLGIFITLPLVLAVLFIHDEPSPHAYRFPKMVVIGYYGILTSFVLFSVLPVLGLTQGSSWAIHSLVIHGFLSGGLMTVLLQFRAKRLEQQRREVSNQLYLSQQQVAMERERREEQTHFLHMLMHELKNPLAVIDMALHTPLEHHQSITYASRAVMDMKAIIERCVDADQLEEGNLETQHQVVDIHRLIKDWAATQHPQEKRLQLCLDKVFNVETDQQYLRIILGNLIDNAIRYSDPQSPIHISVDPAQGLDGEPGVEICVTNHPGLAGWPDADQVFHKYYRSPGALSQSGTGLGLFLVSSLAKRIGALVRYAPDEKRVRFVLWLPA
jgi:signal transduction histidine kinase